MILISANVMKWEKAVADDEKELEKVKNDETRNMEVNQSFFWFTTHTELSWNFLHFQSFITKISVKRMKNREIYHCQVIVYRHHYPVTKCKKEICKIPTWVMLFQHVIIQSVYVHLNHFSGTDMAWENRVGAGLISHIEITTAVAFSVFNPFPNDKF